MPREKTSLVVWRIGMGIFLWDKVKRFVFPYIDSNMYVLAENGEALVIDPHISQEADLYLKENRVEKVTILLTHEHFDHVCGIPWFREHYDTRVVCQQETLHSRRQKHFSRPLVVSLILLNRGEQDKIKELESEYAAHIITAEHTFDEELYMAWQGHVLHLEHLPGHSPASSLITLDEACVFTGDSLVPDAEAIVRWPWSDAETYRKKTVPRLLRIPAECMILPGHRDMARMGKLMDKLEKTVGISWQENAQI